MSGFNDLRWSRSSQCDAGACVEIAQLGESIMLRNSRHPEGPVLTVAKSRWTVFVARMKDGPI